MFEGVWWSLVSPKASGLTTSIPERLCAKSADDPKQAAKKLERYKALASTPMREDKRTRNPTDEAKDLWGFKISSEPKPFAPLALLGAVGANSTVPT